MKKYIALILALALIITLTGFAAREWTSRQTTAHQIAELARDMGLPEDDPIIVRASEIWWSEEHLAEQQETISETDSEEERLQKDPEIIIEEPETQTEPQNDDSFIDLYNGVLPYEVTYNEDTEYLAVMLAQTVYGEFRGGWSQTEQAMVIWTVLNRVDAGMYSSVYAALTAPWQFAYSPYAPTVDDYGRDITALARDVLYRWSLEKQGQTDVGRVLPRGYCWYSGDGSHNYFRCTYSGSGVVWFGLTSPYES